jgi:hypothetical protein
VSAERVWRALAPALLLATVTCATVATASATTRGTKPLPPSSRKELVRILGPKVEPLGLRITRAALVDADNQRSSTGTHLAVYVEPVAVYSPTDYLDGTATVSRAFLPFVFERWPGLRSFDVCQEPPPDVDSRDEPPPETQVFVLRRGMNAVNWKTADLAVLLAEAARADQAAGNTGRPALSVFVARHLQTEPEFLAAYDQASSEPRTEPESSNSYR